MLIIFILAAAVALVIAGARWSIVISEPDEWLLLVRDGKLAAGGIGIRAWPRLSGSSSESRRIRPRWAPRRPFRLAKMESDARIAHRSAHDRIAAAQAQLEAEEAEAEVRRVKQLHDARIQRDVGITPQGSGRGEEHGDS